MLHFYLHRRDGVFTLTSPVRVRMTTEEGGGDQASIGHEAIAIPMRRNKQIALLLCPFHELPLGRSKTNEDTLLPTVTQSVPRPFDRT